MNYEKLLSDGKLNEVGESIRRGVPTAVFGVTGACKALLASLVGKPVLYVAKDILTAERIATLTEEFSGVKCTVLYPKDDVLLYKKAFSRYSLYKRIKSLKEIKDGAKIVFTDYSALAQPFPEKLDEITFKTGEERDLNADAEKLSELGYTRLDYVSGEGTFSLRGDILDVFPVGCENPYRMDYFGDEIETIKEFDAQTREKLSVVNAVTVISATDVKTEESEIPYVCKRLDEEIAKITDAETLAGARTFVAELKEKIALKDFGALSFVLPLLMGMTDNPFSFINPESVVIYDEAKFVMSSADAVEKEHVERLKSLIAEGNAFGFSRGQISGKEKVFSYLKSKTQVAFQTFATVIPFFDPLKTFTLKVGATARYQLKLDNLFTDVNNWSHGGYDVIVYAGNETRKNDLAEELAERGITKNVTLLSDSLEEGVILHDEKLAVIGSGDIYSRKTGKKAIRKSQEFFSAPEVGDYAVHETHGVGKVIGTKRISTTEGTKDYLALEYAGGDVLYVPVEQMDVLTRYLGGDKEPKLSKIGGTEFAKVKERVKESIKKLSFDLKKLYDERSRNCGFKFDDDDSLQSLFDDSFPYDETEDQLTAIEEIKEDMCSNKVMDRLLCGDVGFGKTEVALRAVFRCVSQGKQSALLAPTTILSEQHYNTAVKRFENFGIKVEVLNRFKTPDEQKKILERLKNGDVEFIIGTHRLLGKDVAFKDLGLLVLDEEQRFGVEHKEKLKLIKNNVDTLTMTATPIPRTLHMSLAGIRDISTINTPPKERIPVSTFVTEESDATIKDAVLRELSRGGQVFVLYNRVETISRFADKIKRLVPEAKIVVAHGQMDENSLEEKISSFYRGDGDVLVSTTIIENGIDLPKANTIIVIDADLLGLSTLYQLKGRVGRSNRLAYAYFMFKEQKVLSEEAYKRLNALMEFTEMGSGFKVAMRDLEIRGAGNVMGREQHGHMDKIGYELYSKLLKEEFTGEEEKTACELDIRVNAFIPEEYIPSPSGRMDTYKAIAEMNGVKEFNSVKNGLIDAYGELPLEVINLIRISVVKNIATKLNVKKVVLTKERCALVFNSLTAFKDGKLTDAVEKYKSVCKFSVTNGYEIVFDARRYSSEDTLKLLSKFLQIVLPFGKNN